MRVLVTGASGMLGRSVAELLLERGHEVTTFQRRPSGLECRDVSGDIADAEALHAAAAGNDGIVHLAAKVSPTGTAAEFHGINVDGTANVVAAARRSGIGRLVHVSSPSVAHGGRAEVGAAALPPSPETARNEYSRSKALGERLAIGADGDELRVVAIRPHLVWGPGDTQLVGRIVARARQGRLPLIGNGAALVDSTYVDNAASAIVAALDRVELLGGRALVVTNGEPRTIAELLSSLCVAAGVEPPWRHLPLPVARTLGRGVDAVWARFRLERDPPMTRFLAEQLAMAHWFDQRSTRELLQWEPEVSLDEGLERLAAHFAESE